MRVCICSRKKARFRPAAWLTRIEVQKAQRVGMLKELQEAVTTKCTHHGNGEDPPTIMAAEHTRLPPEQGMRVRSPQPLLRRARFSSQSRQTCQSEPSRII